MATGNLASISAGKKLFTFPDLVSPPVMRERTSEV